MTAPSINNPPDSDKSFLKLGIVGHPLLHTLSPRLHTELLRQADLLGEYLPYDAAPTALAKTLAEFQAAQGRGLNVTIPHKVAVIPLLTKISQNARLLGAVNTVIFSSNGESLGENTDITGFVRSLPMNIQSSLQKSRVLLLGAGGSARAVLAGLLQLHTGHISIMGRQLEKARALQSDAEIIKSAFKTTTEIEICTFDKALDLQPVQGIINSTPVGMYPNVDESPLDSKSLKYLLCSDNTPAQGNQFVYDLIYRPQQTRLLAMAEQLSIPTFNGLDMLILQGVAAFEIWSATARKDSAQLESLRKLLTQ